MICPALRLEDGAGLAETLRAIDCRTGAATAGSFDRLFGAHGLLLPALTGLLTLYVAIFAVGLLTGRTRLGAAALTPRMLTLGLALTFATSWMAYQNVVWTLAVGAPDQLATLLGGTRGSATTVFADRLDTIFAAIADAAQQTQPAGAPAGGPTPAAPGFFTPANMLWLSGLMLLVGTVGVLVTSKIALAALLALGPVFIVLALFRGTRGLFEGWLKAVVAFAMVPMFAVLIGGGTIALIAPLIQATLLAPGDTATRAVIALFLAACVYCALMLLVLHTTRTIVAGWRLPFGREPLAETAAAAPSSDAPTLRVATVDERIRAVLSALPVPANDAAATTIRTTDRHLVTEIHTSFDGPPVRPADARLHGLGSRFRSPPPSPPRTRLS